MPFLPEDYKAPESNGGKFMRFKEAETRFRILSPQPLLGYVGWTVRDNKPYPIRKPMGAAWKDGEVRDNKTRHFWSMAVWNYATKAVQVLEVTQSTIQKAITKFSKDEDYGDPIGYDIVVSKTGEGMDTEYQVTPKPPKKLDKEAQAAWDALQDRFDLGRLLTGGDPFGDTMPTTDSDPDGDIPF